MLEDLAHINCRDELVIFQLSKIVEHLIQITSNKEQIPLSSVGTYLIRITEEQKREYFALIGHDHPYDLSYVNIMLLGRQYQYFSEFCRDVIVCFEHYEKVRTKFNLPDVSAQAKYALYQLLQNVNFTQFSNLVAIGEEQIAQLAEMVPTGDPITPLSPEEAQQFMFLLQSLTPDQLEPLENYLKQQLKNGEIEQTNELFHLNLNHIHPVQARKIIQYVNYQIANSNQVNTTRGRAAVWEQVYQDFSKVKVDERKKK